MWTPQEMKRICDRCDEAKDRLLDKLKPGTFSFKWVENETAMGLWQILLELLGIPGAYVMLGRGLPEVPQKGCGMSDYLGGYVMCWDTDKVASQASHLNVSKGISRLSNSSAESPAPNAMRRVVALSELLLFCSEWTCITSNDSTNLLALLSSFCKINRSSPHSNLDLIPSSLPLMKSEWFLNSFCAFGSLPCLHFSMRWSARSHATSAKSNNRPIPTLRLSLEPPPPDASFLFPRDPPVLEAGGDTSQDAGTGTSRHITNLFARRPNSVSDLESLMASIHNKLVLRFAIRLTRDHCGVLFGLHNAIADTLELRHSAIHRVHNTDFALPLLLLVG